MISQPLVSIIVPCYNVEKYVEECINSIILQDYKNWEGILINDGSSDNTLELINKFKEKDDRIRVFSQENLGLSATRNKGIEHSNGVFIFFLDSDDVLDSHAITTLVSSVSDNEIVTGITVNSKIGKNHIEKISHL